MTTRVCRCPFRPGTDRPRTKGRSTGRPENTRRFYRPRNEAYPIASPGRLDNDTTGKRTRRTAVIVSAGASEQRVKTRDDERDSVHVTPAVALPVGSTGRTQCTDRAVRGRTVILGSLRANSYQKRLYHSGFRVFGVRIVLITIHSSGPVSTRSAPPHPFGANHSAVAALAGRRCVRGFGRCVQRTAPVGEEL